MGHSYRISVKCRANEKRKHFAAQNRANMVEMEHFICTDFWPAILFPDRADAIYIRSILIMYLHTQQKLFIKIILFIMPIVVSVGYIEYRLSQIPNSYNLKRHNFEQNLHDYEVIVLGSSHAFSGINPTYLDRSTFNLANSSQDLYYDSRLLKKYLDRLPSLKLVLVTLSYFSLEYELQRNPQEYWRQYYYFRFWGISELNGRMLDVKNFSLIRLYSPQSTRDYIKRSFQINLATNINEFGWNNYIRSDKENLSPSFAKQIVLRHQSEMSKSSGEKNARLLRELVGELQKRHIQVVFVTLPVYRTYASSVDSNRYQEMQSSINRIAKELEVSYINYFSDSRFDETDFNNVDHFNEQGATKLTSIINTEIINKMKF